MLHLGREKPGPRMRTGIPFYRLNVYGIGTGVGIGELLGILGGVVPLGSQNRDPPNQKKGHFPHPFSDQGPDSRKSR